MMRVRFGVEFRLRERVRVWDKEEEQRRKERRK
jgi:hypothetical protein